MKSRLVALTAVSAAGLLGPLASASAAAPSRERRHTAVFEERVDGRVEPRSRVEAALVQALVESGVPFVDEARARRVRAVARAGELVSGAAIPEVLTPADADVLLAGVVRFQRRRSGLLVRSMTSVSVTVELRALAVDSARVLIASVDSATGVGLDEGRALDAAARAVAERLARRVLEAEPPARPLVTVYVSGLKGAAETELLRRHLEGLPDVERATLHQARSAETTFTVVGPEGPRLAAAMESIPALAVGIDGFSPLEVRAVRRRGRRMAPLPPPPELALESVVVDAITPTRATAIVRSGAGTAWVRRRDAGRAVSRARIETELVGLSRPLRSEPFEVSGEAARPVPLRFELDVEAALARPPGRPAILRVRLLDEKGRAVGVEQSRSVPVLDRHAMAWLEPSGIAAFVTPSAPAIAALTRAAALALPVALVSDPRARPAAVLAALVARGLRYAPDPSAPFDASGLDQVQFPSETLKAGGGDCDDLAVLVAAALEAAGVRTALLLAPGHLFVAFDLGVPARNAAQWSLEPGRLLERDGRLWVPLEATALGRGLADAWSAGAEAAADAGEALRWIEVREAWREHPPVDLARLDTVVEARASGRAEPPPPAEVLAELDAARARRVRTALAEVSGDDAAAWLRRGLLHVAGRRLSEARADFERARDAAPLAALSNLGSVELAVGRTDRALAHYRAALALDPRDARLHANAALAAWMHRELDSFDRHVVACLQLGARELVAELHALVSGDGDPVGAGPASGAGLARRLARHLGAPAPSIRPTARSAVQPDAAALIRLVHWLESEVSAP